MDAQDNAAQNVGLTLRNLLNSVQCVTARVRGQFGLRRVWERRYELNNANVSVLSIVRLLGVTWS